MPITLRTDILKYKNPNTGLYESVDAITDASTADRVAEIASAGTAQVNAVNNAGTNQINSLNARGNELKNIIIAPTRVADDDGLGIIVEAGTTAATEQRMQEARYIFSICPSTVCPCSRMRILLISLFRKRFFTISRPTELSALRQTILQKA